jgi:hypothetical protein
LDSGRPELMSKVKLKPYYDMAKFEMIQKKKK